MLFRVAKVQTFANGRALTNATGLFYLHNHFLYLITSRHVVIDETCGHHPDLLQLSLHASKKNLQERDSISIPLYVRGVPQWYQHPRCGADMVAVAINDPNVLSRYCIDTFCSDDIVKQEQSLRLGQDVLIVGFPLGFHDRLHNLPIVRSATVASSFSHPFNGEPYFLTDARLHRGMSGSPVVVSLPGRAGVPGQREPAWQLLGVHSSSLDVSDRDPNQDERLALNTTWYASLIPQILPESPSSGDADRLTSPPRTVESRA
ncbi:MAG: trypsin-like peptidase domain-containing protein [Planctomycetaceae bacterium]|nr:trypsin-like peptidase domain-containing protein [Planctomycetaceae bacterium]